MYVNILSAKRAYVCENERDETLILSQSILIEYLCLKLKCSIRLRKHCMAILNNSIAVGAMFDECRCRLDD